MCLFFFFFSSRRRHTRCSRDWSSDVCSSDLLRKPPCHFAVLPIQGQGGFRRLKRFSTSPVPVGAKMVVVFKAFVEHGVLLALSHAIKFAFIVVSQANVFHCSSPPGGNQQHSLACWIVHPIVAGHRENRQ